MLCYACQIRSANSLEHIIPAFLGGKKRVRILCHICNNKFGSTFEQNFYNNETAKKLVILKIALNFYFWKNLPFKKAENAIEILKNSAFKEEIIFEIAKGKQEFELIEEDGKVYITLNLNFGSFKIFL